MSFEIAPLRALRFNLEKLGATAPGAADALVAPPYDIIDDAQHAELLSRSPHNITRLTLGEVPGEKEDYAARGKRLLDWKSEGILQEDEQPGFYVYGCEYTIPGSDQRASFRGLVGLGKLHPFDERVVLPHEKTFPRVVDDRYNLLAATRTHLESIFLLYEDPRKQIDAILEESATGDPVVSVEARPGETHSLWPVHDAGRIESLRDLFRKQRPIIADGHHRYTTAILYRDRDGSNPETAPGSNWQPMVFGNLVGDGLSILATHRLVQTGGRAEELVGLLDERLEAVSDDSWEYSVERAGGKVSRYRIPAELKKSRPGVAGTSYAILHQLVLGEWLPGLSGQDPDSVETSFFKEGTGENEALEAGQGDVLFRMRPVSAGEFRSVVDEGEVFPHKTTFFYPKLWSGLTLWSLREPELGGS